MMKEVRICPFTQCLVSTSCFIFFPHKIQTLFERRVFVCEVCDNYFWLQLMF